MSEHTCHCGATIPTDRYACLDCARAAAKDLIDTADHLRATDDKRARRRSNFTTGATSRASETPLPYDPRVRRTLAPIRSALTTWARLIVTEHHCRDMPQPADTARVTYTGKALKAWTQIAREVTLTKDQRGTVNAYRATLIEDLANARLRSDMTDLAAVAAWIADHAEWVTLRPWAMELFNDAQRIENSLARLFDNPPDVVALGPCNVDDCTHLLAATPDATTCVCPHCGHEHDVQQRRLDLLKQADDLNVTLAEAVRLMRITGHDIDQRTMRAIVRHFGIESPWRRTIPGVDHPVAVYPLGKIREAVEAMTSDNDTRKAVNREKRGGRDMGSVRMHAPA